MISALPPTLPPPTEEALELGETPLAHWDGVYLTGNGQGVQAGRLVVTDRNVRFSSEGVSPGTLLHGIRLPDLGGALPEVRPRKVVVPLASIADATLDRSLRVFHKVRLSLRAGGELVFHFGLRSPDALLRAIGARAA